jgi:hypothetical protein
LSDLLRNSQIIELHLRKTQAELMGQSPKHYDAVMAFYRLGLAKLTKASVPTILADDEQ